MFEIIAFTCIFNIQIALFGNEAKFLHDIELKLIYMQDQKYTLRLERNANNPARVITGVVGALLIVKGLKKIKNPAGMIAARLLMGSVLLFISVAAFSNATEMTRNGPTGGEQ